MTLWAGVSPKEFTTLTVTREAADGDQASSGEKVLVGTSPPAAEPPSSWRFPLEAAHDLLTRSVEAAHDGSLAGLEALRGLLVRQARDVDRHDTSRKSGGSEATAA